MQRSVAGIFCTLTFWQFFTLSSNCSVMPGHQNIVFPSFIRTTPGWPSCRGQTLSRSLGGTMTLLPRANIHPAHSSSLRLWKVASLDHHITPAIEHILPTRASERVCVHSFLYLSSDRDVRWGLERQTSSPGSGTVSGLTGRGKRLNRSAFP